MTTINFAQQSAQEIDNEKIKLEASVVAELKTIFFNLASDAESIYKAQGRIDSQQLADNYKPEILKAIRDAYRKSIKRFGFSLRKTIEEKHHLFFGLENKIKIFNFAIEENVYAKQLIAIDDDNIDEKLEEINNQFLLESALFVANESEEQNDIIEQTNIKMIDSAVAKGLTAFALLQEETREEIAKLEARLFNVESATQRRSIAREIDKANRQLELSNANQQLIVARNIKQNILNVREARSTIIAGQNVGLAEAWSRQKEAELIDEANLITEQGETISIEKEWVAILDNVTRADHAAADGQIVGVDDFYSVGGESLLYPRDPRGSISNIINCRCVSVNRVANR
jgi:hypothetical protein